MATQTVGNAGKPRLFAMILDNLVAAILGLVIATSIPGLGDLGRGSVLVTLYLSYYLFPEALWSRTLGKLVCGLVVRKSDGSPCGWSAALSRTFLRILEVNPLLFGALPGGLVVTFSKRKQRVGDMLGDTIVVLSRHDV